MGASDKKSNRFELGAFGMMRFGSSDAPAKRLGVITRNTTSHTPISPNRLDTRIFVARGRYVFIWRCFMTRLLWFLYTLLLIAVAFLVFWFIYSSGMGTRLMA